MKKLYGLISLLLINSSILYLIYWYAYIACSIKIDNIFHVPYEPSGTQLFFYIASLPLFLIIALFSLMHSYYFDLKKSLCSGILIIWVSYFILISYIDLVVHFSTGNVLLYYGTLIISLVAIIFVIYSTYLQLFELTNPDLS